MNRSGAHAINAFCAPAIDHSTTSQNADIYVAIRRSGRWSTPLPVMPGAELDTDVTAAAGHGRIALAWNRGAYPSAPDLAFALVEPGGKGSARVVTADVIQPDVQAEGKTLVAVPDGWILFYTPSSVLRAESRGLFAISLDRDGNQRGHSRLLGGPVLWPVGAARGDRVGVAFTASTPVERARHRGVVGFLNVSHDGKAQGEWVIADHHPDPAAGFRAYSLLPADDGGWWLADVAGFRVSVMIARAPEGRVVKLDAAGKYEKHAVLANEDVGASSVRIVRSGASVRGVYVEDRGDEHLRAFDLDCDAPDRTPPPEDACAAKTEAFAAGRHDPLRGYWEHAIEVEGGDLVVGYRERTRGGDRIDIGDDVQVARVRPSGETVWDTSIGKGYRPSLAYRAGAIAVAVKVDGGAAQDLVLIDAAQGAVRGRKKLSSDAGEHCIIGTDGGWLIASGPGYGGRAGATSVRMLSAAGLPIGTRSFEAFNGCALRADGKDFLIAFTYPGPISNTNHLFLARLDASGRVMGSSRRVEGVGFAREPRFKGDLLMFPGALSRVLRAVRVRSDLSTTEPVDIVRTYGLYGYGFWGESVLWATDEGIGKRTCLDRLGTSL